MQKIMAVATSTDAKVEALGAETERPLKLVMAESEKFASKVATDKAEMDARRRPSARRERPWKRN